MVRIVRFELRNGVKHQGKAQKVYIPVLDISVVVCKVLVAPHRDASAGDCWVWNSDQNVFGDNETLLPLAECVKYELSCVLTGRNRLYLVVAKGFLPY